MTNDIVLENAFCACCQEDFPLAENARTAPIEMGRLYPLTRWRANSKVRHAVESNRFGIGEGLCGNCYFDLTDEMDMRRR